jgi:hypothetical protein
VRMVVGGSRCAGKDRKAGVARPAHSSDDDGHGSDGSTRDDILARARRGGRTGGGMARCRCSPKIPSRWVQIASEIKFGGRK